ncbi:MAG: methyltransferase domain-containing protein [Azospirillum sp.]|nr:methyltransferase domain-containing protein [Azospirillum sp.]
MAWNPEHYELFAALRRRPARDLIAALPATIMPRRIADLGCGGGQLACELAERWPQAEMRGVDSSPAMLATARARSARVDWIEAALEDWAPAEPLDLIVSNAALHWLGNHAGLFPRLMAALNPGGVLAVQMPRNFDAPSHTLLRQTAAEAPWAAQLAGVIPEIRVHSPTAYCDWLVPHARSLDLWETEYLQVMTGDQPVLAWLKGTTLVPVLDRLPASQAEAFLDRLGAHLAAAYPRRADGLTLFPFRRLFVVATRA